MASSAVACAERAEAAVVEYREVFAFHDGDYDGRLTTAEFCAAVRSLGHAPTAMQLDALHATVARIYPDGLAFADFVKVLGTIVEPKIPRASAVAPAASAGLAAFEQLCRRQLTGSLKKRDLAAFLRSPDPLAADETERFMRFVGLGDAAPSDDVEYRTVIASLIAAARSSRA